jgi:ribonuclease-3
MSETEKDAIQNGIQTTDAMNDVESAVGYSFKDATLLLQALTHRSYVNESRDPTIQHNERLEFLGDAVLELVVTDFLYTAYPDKTEGILTSYRAALVNTDALLVVAKMLNLQTFVRLSRGEAQGNKRARHSIIADVVEAIIGALYLDGGYVASKEFIEKCMLNRIDEIISTGSWIDAKSRLQELAQEHLSITPAYVLLSEEGPDHEKIFTMAVKFHDQTVAKGKGSSKQEAEQNAARIAIEQNGWTVAPV